MQEVSRIGGAVFDSSTFPVSGGVEFELEQPRLGTIKGSTMAVTDMSVHAHLDFNDEDMAAFDAVVNDKAAE